MHILVTGGAGFIGSHMVWRLVDEGHEVTAVDDLSTGDRSLLPDSATLVVGDIGNTDLVRDLLRRNPIDAVVNFAAKTVVPDSVEDPASYYDTNTSKALSLLRCCIAASTPFLQSSTAAVYGLNHTQPVTEGAETAPASPYGWSKLMTERIVQDFAAAYGLRYAILRYFNVAGADPAGRTGQSTPNATHLIKAAVEVAVGRRPRLQVFGSDYPTRDGTCVRDFIHVSDLVQAHLAAINHLAADGENLLLNCGYGAGYSVLEVIRAVESASGREIPVAMSGRRAGDPPSVIANADLLRTKLGWRPQYENLEEIVTHAYAWERHRRGDLA